jgi:hypothetical protein
MKQAEIASRIGLSLADLNYLLQGDVSQAVADLLGVVPSDVTTFIAGEPSAAMTQRLGLVSPAAAKELATAVGRPGAVGVILGLLLGL